MLSVKRVWMRAIVSGLAGMAVICGPSLANEKGEPKVAKFRQLETMLPTPNVYRGADGAPGPQYWQQDVDYVIEVSLDESKQRLTGSEKITYTNNAPTALRYLWVSLDQNRFRDDSTARMSETAGSSGSANELGATDRITFGGLKRHQIYKDRKHGFEITAVKDARGRPIDHTIVDTMMRVELPRPLATGRTFTFSIDWSHNLIDEKFVGGRNGFEHFPENDTYLYFAAQWFPRLAAYTDYTGWQNKQFLGRGEFTLEFGDYDVSISVPEDHIVSSTGVLQNPQDVLTAEQRARLKKAESAKKPVYVVTPEEAAENEKTKSTKLKTWRFKADNVRDFAWSSSNKYIWDAMGHRQDDKKVPLVMAMSFYPNEAMPVWGQYSTEAVVHTMDVYSRFSFPYPYPTAQSVNTWEGGGMEYPMITFNGYRPTKDEKTGNKTYSRRVKYGLIGVVIHEIGHIYFPMVVNSDERRWTWMDEGFNTFLEYVAELEWEERFPAFRGKTNILDYIPSYMTSQNQVAIMTQSDSVLQFGPNAYSKPAAAFTVLRETVMGRELFDYAFKEYSQRWKFKRPTPADFFRTMEDASAIDLDWFWRGWFFGTDHVDVAIADVREYKVSTKNPDIEFPLNRERAKEREPAPISEGRNRDEGRKTRRQRQEGLDDFYNENDEFTVTNKDRNSYQSFLKGLEDWERETLERAIKDDEFVYFIDFNNKGGLLTPLPLEITYADGSTEEMMIPAEIWRRNPDQVTKMLISDKAITRIELDKHHQTADSDFSDNVFPPEIRRSRLELYKSRSTTKDLMADMLVELKGEAKKEGDKDAKAVPLTPAGVEPAANLPQNGASAQPAGGAEDSDEAVGEEEDQDESASDEDAEPPVPAGEPTDGKGTKF